MPQRPLRRSTPPAWRRQPGAAPGRRSWTCSIDQWAAVLVVLAPTLRWVRTTVDVAGVALVVLGRRRALVWSASPSTCCAHRTPRPGRCWSGRSGWWSAAQLLGV